MNFKKELAEAADCAVRMYKAGIYEMSAAICKAEQKYGISRSLIARECSRRSWLARKKYKNQLTLPGIK